LPGIASRMLGSKRSAFSEIQDRSRWLATCLCHLGMKRREWLALQLAALAPAVAWAAGPVGVVTNGEVSPAAALTRYESIMERAPLWDVTTIEIEASLPKLGKQGRLRAIRRLLPLGKVDYHVVELEGDSTVKQQVIARYLSAEAQAAARPSSSVAITPANYKFRYAGSVNVAGALSYVFQIAPRKKREGLIRGELWIDAESGIALRQAGRLVRSPSIFLRRVEITRQTDMQDGVPSARITHLNIDARLIGRAELTITERPYATATPGDIGVTPVQPQ